MQKDWKEQGHKNVLTKNTIEAMGWAYVSEYHTTISVELGVSTEFEVSKTQNLFTFIIKLHYCKSVMM